MKPDRVFAREREWAALETFAVRREGPWLGVVTGRRRQGKTMLVDALTEATGGLYFCAAEQSSQQNLEDFGEAFARWLGGGLPVSFTSWDQALQIALAKAAERGAVVALDEIGYLISRFDAFPSLLQRQLDRRDVPGAPVLLCGSSVSVLSGLTGANQPLRGRAALELVVHPFDDRTAKAFWGIADPAVAVVLWALLGGTPAYRRWVSGGVPRRERDLPAWIAEHLLDTASPLHREGRTVELELDGTTGAHSSFPVLAAIARGASTRDSIAAASGRDRSALAVPLDNLLATGLVAGIGDPLHDRRTKYQVVEPIVRVWHQLIEPVERRLLHVDPDDVMDGLLEPLQRLVAVSFEQQVRDWVERHASEDVLGGPVTAVGPSAVSHRRTSDTPGNQIDVVAVDKSPAGHRTVRLLGEVKAHSRPVGEAELRRLETLRDRLGSPETRLLLASTHGFTASVVREARRRPDVTLLEPGDLYT